MKTSKKFLLILYLLFLIVTSCQEGETYCCDPEIDKFVKDNIDEFSILPRQQILDYTEPIQKAIYRTQTPQRQFQVWREKLDFYLKDGSEVEREHNKKLSDILNLKVFLNTEISQSDEFKSSINNWQGEAIDLGYSEKRIRIMLNTLYLDESEFIKKSSKNARNNSTNVEPGDKENCTCARPEGVLVEDCPFSDCAVDYQVCKRTVSGCGTWWLYNCVGTCTTVGNPN